MVYLDTKINETLRFKIQDATVPRFQSNRPRMQILNQTYKMRIQNYE
jgi:hypothetical protein